MIDWSTVFESARPENGATEARIARFLVELGLPADRPVPPSYLSFVRYSDGGSFRNGDRYFRMCGTHIRAEMNHPEVPQPVQLTIPFAGDGAGHMYMFDMRELPDSDGEYPIICAHTGTAPLDPFAIPKIADTFPDACRGQFSTLLLFDGSAPTAELWDVCADPEKMFDYCQGNRKLRLFACACARRVWSAMPDKLFREAVEFAERFADGKATDKKRKALKENCEAANRGGSLERSIAAEAAIDCLSSDASSAALHGSRSGAGSFGADESPEWHAEHAKQADLLREIFGNPLRPVRLEPEWLTWNNRTVPQIAARIYETNAFHDLPILADAVEEAGCSNAELLAHLRRPGGHVRGCWALDLLRDEPI